MGANLSPERALALIDDLDVSQGFIEHGLDQLAKVDGANDFHQLPMHLLSNGIERLLKLTYAVAAYTQNGQLPSADQLRSRFGHDLTKINDALADLAATEPSYVARPACLEDLDFMRNDELLRLVLDALTAYARQGRYHNLSTFLGGASPRNPDESWQALETAVLHDSPGWQAQLGTPGFSGFYAQLAKVLTATLQRYARAVCRMWTLGPLGDMGKANMPSQFLMVTDEQLGELRRVRTRR